MHKIHTPIYIHMERERERLTEINKETRFTRSVIRWVRSGKVIKEDEVFDGPIDMIHLLVIE